MRTNQETIKIKPNSAFAYSNLSNLYKESGDLKEAELLQNKALTLKPDVPEMHNNMGSILKDLGKIIEAESHLKKAILVCLSKTKTSSVLHFDQSFEIEKQILRFLKHTLFDLENKKLREGN